MDLFTLTDFEILVYMMPKVKDRNPPSHRPLLYYRPVSLSISSFLMVKHLSVCSNIVAESIVFKNVSLV